MAGMNSKIPDQPRLLVIGAGVNGSACAAALFRAGLDVTVLARGARCDDLKRDGIVIENPFSGARSITRVPVIDQLAPDDVYDFVLVVVRKNQVADLLPALARNSSPNIVFMGNNILGPDDMIRALGSDRVMLGFVFAGGRRFGSVIRAMVMKSRWFTAPFGEVNGTITPRLQRLTGILRSGGFHAKAVTGIADFLVTHGAGVALLGQLLLKHGSDPVALARSRGDLRLMVEARREAFRVLRALGHRITPATEALLAMLPVPVQIAAFALLLNSKFGQVGCSHVSQAADEMNALADELKVLVERAGIPVPAVRQVLAANQPR
jgi:2-dehydropantoate 2-reductase